MVFNNNRTGKVRDMEFCNSTINRVDHYSNILSEQSKFITDNGIKDFSLINSSKKIQTISDCGNESFI